jgi:hypothetical protein
MAKEKHEHEMDNVYQKGDKYYCSECHQEVPVKQVCHTCKKEIDWDRVMTELRR